MAKHIGIIACSAEGAALCYRTICSVAASFMGEHNHPEITMHTIPLSKYMVYIRKDEWNQVAEIMLSSTKILKQAGADFAICPDNTIHQSFDLLKEHTSLPLLHIAEVVAQEARKNNFNKLGLCGTKYLMEGPVYPNILKDYGIEFVLPVQKDRIKINEIIFKELVYGQFLPLSRDFFYDVFYSFKSQGCDGVILGCTEIPLIIEPNKSPLAVLDSTRLLAKAAVEYALE